MVLKSILKYGASFAAGVVTGRIIEEASRDTQTAGDKLWKGETTTLEYSIEQAEKHIEVISNILDETESFGYKFMEEDLYDIRRKLSHGISDAKDANEEEFEVEMYDRQRLRMLEIIMANTMIVQDEEF